MSDIVKFIVRRELLLVLCSSMIVLRRWRASFINALRDLNLSGSEEMDLLVKWFGSESADHAKRIRAVHICYPQQGLRVIRTQLNKC